MAMPQAFDPYHQWLGIPPAEQPPHHYRLLGIPLFEDNPKIIESAADRQMAHLRTFQIGQHWAFSQMLLNAVATAKVCLLNPQKKAAYDRWLRQSPPPRSDRTVRSAADSLDPELLAAIVTSKTSASSGGSKKSQPKPAMLIGAAVLTVAVVGLGALGWAMGRGATASDKAVTNADQAPSAKATQYKASEPQPSRTPRPSAVSTPPKEDRKSADSTTEIAKSNPVLKPPEPETEEVIKSASKPEEIAEPKPFAKCSPAEATKPSEHQAPAKKLVSPSADEQTRLMSEIDEVYELGKAKDQATKAALARKLLDDGRKNEANRAQQFVLLRCAGEIARDAGAADLVLEAVDSLVAAGFDIRPVPVKSRLLKRLIIERGVSGGASRPSVVCASCVKFAEEAAADGALDEALELLDASNKSFAAAATRAQTALHAAKAALVHARTLAERAEREKKAGGAQRELDEVKSAQSSLAQCRKGLQQSQRERESIRPPLAVAPFNEKMAKRYQARWAKYLDVSAVQTDSIGMKLVLVPPGEFQMGSTKQLIEEELLLHAGDDWYSERLAGEGPQHRVRITRPYWLGLTLVTQEEYQCVMGSNPSNFRGDSKRPVEQVSWDDAVEFCRRLSEMPGEKAAKRRYALPTEAQWEYACRVGNGGRWCFSAQPNPFPVAVEEKFLGQCAWFNANAASQTHPVGKNRPNAWGLYDMHGNVWEWCQDWYDKDYYALSATDDPVGPLAGSVRVLRGGSWFNPAGRSRSAFRHAGSSGGRASDLGFRVAQLPADK